MAATNLETEGRCRLNSPRDLQDASEVSVATDITVALDGTAGATFVNTGNQVLLFTIGTDSEHFQIEVLRNGVDSEYVGTDRGDDSGHAYDLVDVTPSSDTSLVAVGPFDPKRYNDASGLITIKLGAGGYDGTYTAAVLDISSRRTARSTATKGYRYDESSTTQLGPVD